jgi:hypothetical protein
VYCQRRYARSGAEHLRFAHAWVTDDETMRGASSEGFVSSGTVVFMLVLFPRV